MKRMYNINDLGAELKLPCHEAPGPRGVSLEYDWNGEAAKALVALFREHGATEVVLDGHPPAWLACYLAIEMAPVPVSLFIPPLGGDIPMASLEFGPEAPEGHVRFQTEPFADGVLVGFAPDTRDFQADFMKKVRVPEAPKGRHVYLQGMAPNFVAGSLALTLAACCPSVSVSGPDGRFVCVSSEEPSKQVGQVTATHPFAPPPPAK